MNRDYGLEIDELKRQLAELQAIVKQSADGGASRKSAVVGPSSVEAIGDADEGAIYYSGQFRHGQAGYRWDVQERSIEALLQHDSEKMAKVLAALGNKQRLDILRTLVKGPQSGTELVERLQMGTTGQLYHHIKALMGADLLAQEERGGDYSLPSHRVLPVLLLLAAGAELADTGNYLDMVNVRDNASLYLGAQTDPHLLVWALLENSIMEHKAGYCSEVVLFVHDNRSITVADNGRGIPVETLSSRGNKPNVQEVLTEIGRPGLSAPFYAPGGEKGISVAVINALSERLSVEIRRDGGIYRQDYKYGIPQSGIMAIGSTRETGTSVYVEPDADLFRTPFDTELLEKRAMDIQAAYPGLTVAIHKAG